MEAKGKLSGDSSLEREGNQVLYIMMKLTSNDEVDELELHNGEVDK